MGRHFYTWVLDITFGPIPTNWPTFPEHSQVMEPKWAPYPAVCQKLMELAAEYYVEYWTSTAWRDNGFQALLSITLSLP